MRPINFRTLDLNLLKVFDAVMLERNVTRAAERLSMPHTLAQPCVHWLAGTSGQTRRSPATCLQRLIAMKRSPNAT